jgi:CubicO group peptidase (beta-lactamase class C family)
MSIRKLLSSLIVLVLCLSVGFGQVKLSTDTPAGQVCSAWLEAFNSGDRDTYRAFVQKYAPARLDRLDSAMEFRSRTGGLDLKKVESTSPTEVVAIVKERGTEQFVRMTFSVQPNEPHNMAGVNLEAIPTPAEFAPAQLSDGELADALQKKLQQESDTGQFSGTALLAKNGKPIFEHAYGMADREHKLPNTLATRFRIGSMNKMFTAVAVLQLAQAGKLKLDDPFSKYLTDYPNKELASTVTLHQLLTHTGGTGDIFGPDFDKHRTEIKTLQDYVKLYGNRGAEFPPGSKWAYSNYGFILLGLVVEQVSGQSYYDYISQHIYDVAGMKDSGSDPEDKAVANRSVGYTKPPGTKDWKPNTDTLPYRGSSAGGGYSTVGDLLKFADALEQHKLLDAHYEELLTTGKVDEGTFGRYAYGFEDKTVNGARCFGHGGGAPGMTGDLQICPASGYVIAVLANMDPPAARRISDFITNRMPGLPTLK